nr:hypothetical protein [Tanacetum cinerariifolium]
RVFDFPAAKPESYPAYDFFTAEPIPGLAEAPGNINEWIEEDGPLGADLMEPVIDLVIDDMMEPVVDPVIDDMMEPMKNPVEDVDMLMDDDDEYDDDEGEDDEDGWEVNKEWMMAPVTPSPLLVVPPPSTFEDGGPSTAAPGPPFLVGRPFLEVVSSVGVHHEEIEGYSIRIENLEHAHGVPVRKTGDVNDARLDNGIAIGEIQPRVTTLEGQVDRLRKDVDGLLGLKDRVQTLKSTIQELRLENQKMKRLLSAKDSDYSMLASYVLWLGEHFAAVELQLPRLPQGPQ